jgi:hypothetical protein
MLEKEKPAVDVWWFSSPSKLPDFVSDWFEGLIAHLDQTSPAKVNVNEIKAVHWFGRTFTMYNINQESYSPLCMILVWTSSLW